MRQRLQRMHKGPFAYEEKKTYVPICSLASLHGFFVRFIQTRLSLLIYYDEDTDKTFIDGSVSGVFLCFN